MKTRRPSSAPPATSSIASPAWLEALYDAVPDTVFFIKDDQGRYTVANQTLATRLGLSRKTALAGKTVREVFPGLLGERYATQDEAVLSTGQAISGVLELHIYPSGEEGWCLTWKMPVTDERGRIVGLAGMSRDLPAWSVLKPENRKLARVIEHIHRHLAEPMRLPDLAELAGLSAYQLDARVRQLFGVSTAQFIIRTRIARACQFLQRGSVAVSAIALACGYSDQAAFTRQFRQSTGLTPLQYRNLRKG
jgi:PAS domain S-box-containing protein